MKKLLSLCTLLMTISFCIAQTAQETVAQQYLEYFETIKNHEFEKSVNYMPTEMFEIASKEDMLSEMEAGLNNPDVKIAFTEPKILSVGVPKLIDSKYYSIMRYGCTMSMTFLTDEMDNQGLVTSFNSIYGSKNVKFDIAENRFDIYYEKNICAISTDGKSNWKFVELEPTALDDLKFFIPQEILDLAQVP